MSTVVELEEAKRESHIAPADRWRMILDVIRWAERQATVRRNTRERCLEEQSRKNAPQGDRG